MRIGTAVVLKSPQPVDGPGCKGKWYAIEPRGYVCDDNTATLDLGALDRLLGGKGSSHSRQKGSAWVFCARDGKIVASDYYPSLLPADGK